MKLPKGCRLWLGAIFSLVPLCAVVLGQNSPITIEEKLAAIEFVTPMSALIIVAIAGTLCFFTVTELKKRLGYDDSLDTFGVHGISGFTGAILCGIFANSAVNPVFTDASGKVLPSGLLEGNGRQLLNQIFGAAIATVLGVAATYVLLLLVDKTVGLRVTGEDEIQGLDVSQHGEEGYNLDLDIVAGGNSFAFAANAVGATVQDYVNES